MNTVLSRRRLLQLLGAVPLLASCTSAAKKPAAPDPDDALRAAAVERERVLLALYDTAAAGTGPADAAVLQAVRAEHAEHLAALVAPPSPSPSPSAVAASTSPATRPQLVAAERSAAQAHALAAVTASPQLAGLLASLAASEASHPVVLA